MAVIKAQDLVSKVKDIAQKYKTVYCWGSFGFPITSYNIDRLSKNYPSIYNIAKKEELKKLIGEKYFAFDCVGLIKGVLWGFNGDLNKANGGTVYCSNGVSDIDCNTMFDLCSGKTSDFSSVIPGEFLWMQGHIGVYIGDGLAVEATASWNNKVMITAVGNMGSVSGYKTRSWTKHGKCPYVDYSDEITSEKTSSSVATVKECNNIYISEGIAAIRKSATTSENNIKGRCVNKKYYTASQIIKPSGSNQEWFRHADSGYYSALTDYDGTKLFTLYGTYKKGISNATVKVRASASLSGAEIDTLDKGTPVYLTGKTAVSDNVDWVQVVYDGGLCWCAKLWIDC